MKNILIIYPHWPPSNLAGVHRARLISNFLPEFGWNPIVLTVHEDYYEEKLDYDFVKTVRPTTEVIKVPAYKARRGRIVGDIGIRAFLQLQRRAKQILREREIDFIWVPVPSYYPTLMLPSLYKQFKVPYGIDYIDPWVKPRDVLGRFLSKAYLSNLAARILEPYAVSKAALITGVDQAYYRPVLDRNFNKREIANVGMPYGFDPKDHQIELKGVDFPWKAEEEAYVYAGAFLPKSHYFLKSLFSFIQEKKNNEEWPDNKKLYFLGTGNYPGRQIREYAQDYGIESCVIEKNERYPFLNILYFLNQAKGVIVLGSTEKHYTASKIFQSILSKQPIFPVFHNLSSAVRILGESKADKFLVEYSLDQSEDEFRIEFSEKARDYFLSSYDWEPSYNALDRYSAKASTQSLVNQIEKLV
jgi:hypothetical protein